MGYGRSILKHPRSRVLAAAAVLLLIGGGAAAQTSPPEDATTQAVVAQAEADVAAGRYGRAIERYRQLLKVTADDAAAFDLALRLAELANAVGRPDLSYDALFPRMKAAAGVAPEQVESGYELLTEAAGMLGRQDDAVGYARSLAAARLKRLGENAPATLAARLTLSVVLEQAGAAEEARGLRQDALTRLERGDPGLYVRLLNNTAIVLQNSGKLDSAAEMFGRLVQALAAEPESTELGITQFNLAVLDRDRRHYESAIEHHQRAIEILERLEGPLSPETIAAVGGLGQTYDIAGRPAAALPFLRDAHDRAVKALGDTDDTMIQANNLANVLRQLQRFDEAEPLDRSALTWRERNLGPADDSTLISRKNLALDLIGLDRPKEAMELYRQVVTTLEKERGRDNPATMDLRRERDMLAMLTGTAPADDAAFGKLVADAKPSAGSVRMANLLAGIAEKQGDLATEGRLHRLSLKLSEAYYGELDPHTLAMLTNVARSERQQTSKTTTATYRALELRLRLWSRREIASTSDPAVMELVAATTREPLGDILSYCLSVSAGDPAATELFATVLLEWKDVLSLERTMLDTAAAGFPAEDRALLDRVRELQAESLRQPRNTAAAEQTARQLGIAEATLSDRITGLRKLEEERRRSYAAILSTLGPKEAVVDTIIAPLKVSDGVIEDRILAMVGRSDGSVWLYNLGAAADVERWLQAPDDTDRKDVRRALYKSLIAPLEAKLDGIERLDVVPDGILHLVPFDGLIDESGRNLIETRDVRIARSARAIHGDLEPQPPVEAGGVLLAGDVDYGTGSAMSALPFTGMEVDTIAGIMAAAGFAPKVLRGDAADEADIRSEAGGRRILHFATHGFFDPISKDEAAPLWRAGIALASANAGGEDHIAADDGVLYAAEMTTWPLSGVDLVVLSACDTAQGDRSYVEGLSGLPSALAIAGARRSLLARWPVDDRGTALFMVRFYQALAESRSYEQAIRAAKLDAITGKLPGVPDDVWLAFAMIAN
ncbi:CHAT domain-containing tetratricopeptide repeat protein [Inquilinus sp. OTU3971]|uniref:CHAT domain-containing tetratricopeptide repeat protein n=1 Tax=Inquilinus sp. OTU3971 TaxID=3043855 RepID=UPI00313CC3FB